MPRPSEVVWQHRHDPAVGPVPGSARPTPRETAERVRAGEPWKPAVRELLDGLATVEEIDQEEPELVEPHLDAYLAAVVEDECSRRAVAAPVWVRQPQRFLTTFWWPDGDDAFRALCLVQSPAAFRRRGIFIGATTTRRV